jgi:hypothetical protein
MQDGAGSVEAGGCGGIRREFAENIYQLRNAIQRFNE